MRGLITFIAAMTAIIPAANADEVLGSWCWRMAPNSDSMNASMVLTKVDSGAVVLDQIFYDGSKRTVELQQAGSNRYLYKGSEFGDGVSIRADGSLQMFDSEGPLEVAKPRSKSSCVKK